MNSGIHLLLAGALCTAVQVSLAQPTVEFSATDYTTGENEATVALTVLRSGDSDLSVTVDFATADGTALAGEKYTAVSGTLRFAAGEGLQTIAVPLINDGLPGGPTNFRVDLSNPTGGAVLGTRAVATVSIADVDGGLTFRFATYSVAENVGASLVGIARGDDGNAPMTVDVTTTDGTAQAGLDYTGLTETVAFAANEHLKFVSIPIVNNTLKDGNRNFRVTLSNPVGGALGCTKTASVTILDNDAGFEFETARFEVAEDSGVALIPVQRGNDDTSRTVTVSYATTENTASDGADYTGVAGAVEFAPGETVKELAIPILNDGIKESTETFRVALSNPNGGVLGTRTTATVSIRDNDPGTGFETAFHSVWAGAGEITLPVLRGDDGSPEPFTIDYTTSDGTAGAGEDYQAVSGTLEFTPNDMIKEIPIPIFRAAGTVGIRTFTVTLSNSTGAAPLGIAVANVRIHRNECVVTPPFSSGLELRREAGTHTLTWQGGGALQRANHLTGPWQTLASAHSPHRAAPWTATTFYRVTHPRPVSVFVPSSYDPERPLPLVLLLHGGNGSGRDVEDYMRFRPLAESRGFLYCYPDATLNHFGYRFWNADGRVTDPAADWGATITDDAGYLRDLIEEIARRFTVDRKRIYVTGRSNGGVMAHRMACQFADLVAGIATHPGALASFYNLPGCVPSEPVHVLNLFSLEDRFYWGASITLCMGYYFNQTLPAPSALKTMRTWAAYNGTGEPVTDEEPTMDLVNDVPGLDTIVTRHPNHPPGGAVEQWTMTGGPHSPSVTTNYAPAIIDWLLAHPKP